MNILNLLKQIGCINVKSDGICNISSLRDECWAKMFAEQGYTKGELIFPDGGHSSFFLVLPDGNIASADNVMCANGFYAIAEELGFDADEVLGTEPYGQFFMYEDDDGLEYEDCSISIWTPQEFLMKMKQCKQLANINETIQEAYDLDAEMAVWEKRANSKFGQLLKQLDDVTREEMGCELDEYGFEQSIISHYITAYSLDGDKSYTLKTIKHILGEYDLLQNKRIRNLVSQLEMSLNESKNMKSKNTIRLTESELKKVITESVKNILKENCDNIESQFSDWALNGSKTSHRGFNAMGKLYEYYYEDNDNALYAVAEEFSDEFGCDIEDVYEVARKFANQYFYYNPVEMEEEEMYESCNQLHESDEHIPNDQRCYQLAEDLLEVMDPMSLIARLGSRMGFFEMRKYLEGIARIEMPDNYGEDEEL